VTSAFQTLALSKSPVCYWPMEAGSGADIGSAGINLTLSGSYATASTPLVLGGGDATTFDGSTGNAQTASQSTGPLYAFADNAATGWSWCFWVNPIAQQTDQTRVIAGTGEISVTWAKATNTQFPLNAMGSGVQPMTRLNAGDTLFCAYVYDSSEGQLRCFINGQLDAATYLGLTEAVANPGVEYGQWTVTNAGSTSATLTTITEGLNA
jgi:hypothetical protein